jgi:hypothetical protein
VEKAQESAQGHIEETNLQRPALTPQEHASTIDAKSIEQDTAAR